MKKQFYFQYSDSEICYNKSYFDEYMKDNNLTELEVYIAIPEIIGGGIFWCKEHQFCGDGTNDTCGNDNCSDYLPRNKKNGVCIHHRHWLYTHGEKITITKNRIN